MNNNSLFKEFNSNSNPFGQFNNFLTQLQQFGSNFSGNPETRVRQLLQTGQMSQEQFSQLAQTATQLRKFLK